MEFWSIFVTVLCAFGGALVGGWFTLKGVKEQYALDLKKQQQEEEQLVRNFQQMIRTEVQTLWDRYQITMGQAIDALEDDQPLLLIFPMGHNYFTVYDNNAGLVGKIDDEDLRRLIVMVYIRAKGLLDSFRMNNEICQEYTQASLNSQLYQNQIYPQLVQVHLVRLKAYAAAIKKEHNELRQIVQDLITRLN